MMDANGRVGYVSSAESLGSVNRNLVLLRYNELGDARSRLESPGQAGVARGGLTQPGYC
jgi:hypothetical protein